MHFYATLGQRPSSFLCYGSGVSGLERLAEALVLLGAWGVAVGMGIESAAIPLPSEVVLPYAGYLVSIGRLGFGTAVFAATLGGLCGSAASYAVARWGG